MTTRTEFPPFSRVLRLNSPASLSPQNSVPGPRDGEAEAEAERLPMTTRRAIRNARKGAGWISGVRLEPEPAPAVRAS